MDGGSGLTDHEERLVVFRTYLFVVAETGLLGARARQDCLTSRAFMVETLGGLRLGRQKG